MERWFVAASTVLQALSQNIMVKRALNRKTKNLIYQLFYISTLTCGHELQVVTKRMRLPIRVVEISFLGRVQSSELSRCSFMTKEPSDVQESDQDTLEHLSFRSSGHNQLRGATKQTQNLLEGLFISSGLEHLRTLREVLECCLGERLLEYPAATSSRPRTSRKRWTLYPGAKYIFMPEYCQNKCWDRIFLQTTNNG